MPDRSAGRGLHRFAVAVAVATLGLIAAGGLVTSTESGLSVPDWPTTYGQNPFTFPPSKWVGGIRFEHTHRLIASAVGLMTVVLALWLARREPRAWVRRLGWLALAAVVAQGILGGLTVKFLLPTAISVAHACLAQSFFCLAVTLAVVTSPRWVESAPGFSNTVSRAAAALVGLVFLQLLVGAVMRHTKAGLAIPDFPLAFGAVVPPIASFPVGIHFAHRLMALVVAAASVFGFVRARRSGRPALRRISAVLVGLVILQVALGAATVLSKKDFRIATAHVVTGALLLGTSLVGALVARRRQSARQVEGRVFPMPLAGRRSSSSYPLRGVR
jgi:cytochrome c oxidase assembly protein subunit 15